MADFTANNNNFINSRQKLLDKIELLEAEDECDNFYHPSQRMKEAQARALGRLKEMDTEQLSEMVDKILSKDKEGEKIFKRGDRVQANQQAGFHKGAKGTVQYVEPSGKIWVLRDGASGDVFYHAVELDLI